MEGNGGEPRKLAALRRCPRCQEIRRFLGRKCQTCCTRISPEEAEVYPPLDSIKCKRCKRMIAASVDGYCGRCSTDKEFKERDRRGSMSREDRVEQAYMRRRVVT